MPDQGAMLEERKLQERQFQNQRELDRINHPDHHDT